MAQQFSMYPSGLGGEPVRGQQIELDSPNPVYQLFVIKREEGDLWFQYRDPIAGPRGYHTPWNRWGTPLSAMNLIAALEQGRDVWTDDLWAGSMLLRGAERAPEWFGTEFLVLDSESSSGQIFYPAYGLSTDHIRRGDGSTTRYVPGVANLWPGWGMLGKRETERLHVAIDYIKEYGFTQPPPPELIEASPPEYGPAAQPVPGYRKPVSHWDTFDRHAPVEWDGRGPKPKARKPYRTPAVHLEHPAPKPKLKRKSRKK